MRLANRDLNHGFQARYPSPTTLAPVERIGSDTKSSYWSKLRRRRRVRTTSCLTYFKSRGAPAPRTQLLTISHMGHGIASNLLKAGYTTRVYNRTKEKAKDLVDQGAILVNQPSDVIESDGIVFTMLFDDSALREIAEVDENFVKKLHPGGIHVSLSTVSPDTARSLSAHHSQNGVTYLAAPVIGRPDRAAAGTLFILLAGSVEAKQIVSPFLEKISQRVFDFGDLPWSSNMAKLAFNFNIAAAIEAMAESFTLAEKNGIPRAKMAELLSETLFSGVVYKGYGDLIAHHSYQPGGVPLMFGWKDIRLVLQTSADSSTPMPIASL